MDNFLFFEDTTFSEATGDEKRQLTSIQLKLIDIIEEINSQPEGQITVKKSGSISITGFSETIRKKISDRIHS